MVVANSISIGSNTPVLSSSNLRESKVRSLQSSVMADDLSENNNNNNGTTNPLKSDPTLVLLLKKLPTITKYKYFHRWKKSFLDRLLPQILSGGTKNQQSLQVANRASEQLEISLLQTAKQAHKVVDFHKAGSSSLSSVKATLALRELGTGLAQTTQSLQEWIPASSQDEKRQGYTKFHLGAALIQQGFPQYITLQGMEDAVTHIQNDILPHATHDRQLTSILEAYRTQVQRFCDVMADLGMYEIMKKCLQFAVAPDVEESSDEEAMEIIVEGETLIDNGNGNDTSWHSVTIEKEPSEIFDSILPLIESEFGIPITELVLKHNGEKELQQYFGKNKSFGKVGIHQDGTRLLVGLRQLQILVHAYGSSDAAIPVQVTCRNTLHDIKNAVAPASGIAVAHQRLFLLHHQPASNDTNHKDNNELTDDQKTVKDYGFVDHQHLYLEPKCITLRVQPPPDFNDATSIEVQVSLDHTSNDIQTQIAQQTGLQPPQFTTLRQGRELPNETAVREMKLRDGEKLQMQWNKFPVTVQRHKGDGTIVAQLLVHPTDDTLATIKDKLKDASGMDPAQMILHYKNRRLENDADTVQTMKLQPNSVLYLDTGPIVISSLGEIYVSFTVHTIQEGPSVREYKELAKVTKKFYARLLKRKYPDTFQNIQVECHKGLFEANIPSNKFNVYVEWDFTATFETLSSSSTTSGNIPTRHALCSFLVQADLGPYLDKVSKMPTRSFSKTCGVYTCQTDAR